MRNVSEETKALKTHPTVALMISLLEGATSSPIILTGQPGTFSIWSMRPEFDGFNAKDLGLESIENLFEQSTISLKDAGRSRLFLQAADGLLLSGELFIYPREPDRDHDCYLEVTVTTDTPTNRREAIHSLSEKVLKTIKEQVDTINKATPYLLGNLVSKPGSSPAVDNNSPSMG